MAILRYRRTKVFHRETNAYYFTGLNECRAIIIKANPGVDFSFITSETKTQSDPNFQVEGGDVIPQLVPLDDEYEATIDIEESERRHHDEGGEEVEQPMSGEASVTTAGDEAAEVGGAGEAGAT